MDKNNTSKRLTYSIVLVIILLICLAVTTYALAVTSYRVIEDNRFGTGKISIKLEGLGSLDLTQAEPGMTIEREFTIRNMSSIGVYYKVYFENISGSLADVIDITLTEKESGTLLYSGKAADFKYSSPNINVSDELTASEARVLVIRYHIPKDAGNSYMGTELSFYISAKAVQSRNNADKSFD